MDTRVFSAYNETSKLDMCSRLYVVDAAREPIKVLKILMEGIGPDPKSGLVLINFKGIPVARSQTPFDLVYLDIDSRVLQAVEISLHSIFEKFKGQPEAALVLPPRIIHASKTFSGDHIVLRVVEEEAGLPIPEVARPATPKASTRIVPAASAKSYNVPSKGTGATHSGPLMRSAAAGLGKPVKPGQPTVEPVRSEARQAAAESPAAPTPPHVSAHDVASVAVPPTLLPVYVPKQDEIPAPAPPDAIPSPVASHVPPEPVAEISVEKTLPPHEDAAATGFEPVMGPQPPTKGKTEKEVESELSAETATVTSAPSKQPAAVETETGPAIGAVLDAAAEITAPAEIETSDKNVSAGASVEEALSEQAPPVIEDFAIPAHEEPPAPSGIGSDRSSETIDEPAETVSASEEVLFEQPALPPAEQAEVDEPVAQLREEAEPIEDTSPRLVIVSKSKPQQPKDAGTFVGSPAPLDTSLASLFSAGIGAPPAASAPITPEEKRRNDRVEALSRRWDVRFVYWLFPDLRPSYRPDIEAPRIDPVKDMQLRSKKKKKMPRKIRMLSSLYPDLELETIRQRQGRARRAPRIAVPGLVGYYYTGGTSFPYEIRNISVTGFYMLTDERWSPGTVIRVTLQMTESDGDNPGDTITIHARVVNWDETGAGFEFVLPGFME